ncbi:CoA-binding protein [Ignavibacterium album]|uniref:CoA-binding protein n=1 Tax=Ignavibacterium album TaxID=591197 RepID=UPI0026EB5669|nr:CoA-binding protein [Ignavibacterium album]
MSTRKSIDRFLSNKNIAVIGVSSKGRGFGVAVYEQLKYAGYKVFGVNKNGGKINNEIMFKSLGEISSKVDAVVTVIPPPETEKIIDEMKMLSINQIWMQQGSESKEAIEKCKSNGSNVINGECILMFVEPVKSFHSFHRWINKLIREYPD